MFSPPGIITLWFLQVALKALQLENLDSRNRRFSLTDCEVTKRFVTPVISLFANSSSCLGVRISSEKGLCKLAQAANLFKVPRASYSSILCTIIAHNYLPFFKIFSKSVYFCPNFQIILPSFTPFKIFFALFLPFF